jgi:hypothetical protein
MKLEKLWMVLVCVVGCVAPDPDRRTTQLPRCDAVCPHDLTCDPDVGWSCITTGDACQDIKPCGDNPPDCEVVCPDEMTCDADESWTCGRPDVPCLSEASCTGLRP